MAGHTIIFAGIPSDHRSAIANVIALGWNTYLSVVNKKSSDKVKEKKN